MVKLVASDLDGTIIDKNNLIFSNNFKAFDDLHKHNMNFVVCTGKTYPITKKMCSEINAKFGIFGNGNLIMDLENEKVLYKNLLSISEVLSCIDVAKEHNMHVHIYTESEVITEQLKYLDLRNHNLQDSHESGLSFKTVDNIRDYVELNNPEIFKLVISDDFSTKSVKEELENKLDLSITTIRKFGEYKDFIINKEYEYLDITPVHIGKGYALEYLSNFLNVNRSDVMAIGDNINDIDMIKTSGVSATLADSYDEVKNIASYITKNSSENAGFAEAVYKFI